MRDWKTVRLLPHVAFTNRCWDGPSVALLDRKLRLWGVACIRRQLPQLTHPAFRLVAEMALAEAEFVAEGDAFLARATSGGLPGTSADVAGAQIEEESPRFLRYDQGRAILVVDRRFQKETDEELEALGFEIHSDDYVLLDCPNGRFSGLDQPIIAALNAMIGGRSSACRGTPRRSKLHFLATGPMERTAQQSLFRCVLGPPAAPDLSRWAGALVLRLAETIYREDAWHEVGVLGDALEEAGCADPDVLWACRTPPHAKGFWVVDGLRGLPHLPYKITW